MRKFFSFFALGTLALIGAYGVNSYLISNAQAASAKIKVGDKAPQIVTQGAIGGTEFNLNLQETLKQKTVVLYFFPKVFTQGCTLEAHEFAEATDDFLKAGALVIGMSGDDINGLKKFSTEACRDKFAVAQASPATIKAYNVALGPMNNMSNRTSFVIGKDGKIKFIHSNMDYRDHVKLTLEAVKALK